MKSKYLKDFSGYFFKFFYKNGLNLKRRYYTLLKRTGCRLRGIKLEKGCIFFGNTVFHRVPLSHMQIGDKCCFRSSFLSNFVGLNHKCMLTTLREGALLSIGNRCGISGATISAAHRIVIHDDVLIGANVLITDFDWHNIDPAKRHVPCTEYKPVEIHKNVWIGINSIVLKGVTIGENTVIGANSIVTADIPANVIAAGNPCKVIKEISSDLNL